MRSFMSCSTLTFPWITRNGVFLSQLQIVHQPKRLPQTSITGCPEMIAKALKQKLDSLSYEFLGSLKGRFHFHFSHYKERANPQEAELPCLIGLLLSQQRLKQSSLIAIGSVHLDGTIELSNQSMQILGQTLKNYPERFQEFSLLSSMDFPHPRSITLKRVSPSMMNDHLPSLLSFCTNPEGTPSPKETHRCLGKTWFKSLPKALQQVATLVATGWHSLVFIGPPGVGKSYFAQGLVHFQSDLSSRLQLPLSAHPIVQPNPQSSPEQMVFGYQHKNVTSHWDDARWGVLWIDELPEFRRDTLEALRSPLDGYEIDAPRQIVISMNPCPCGFWSHNDHLCTCSPRARSRYWNQLSGPLLDRISIGLNPERVEPSPILKIEDDYELHMAHMSRAFRSLLQLNPRFQQGSQWLPSLDLPLALSAIGVKNPSDLRIRPKQGYPTPAIRRFIQREKRLLTLWALQPEVPLENLIHEANRWDSTDFANTYWERGPAPYAENLEEISSASLARPVFSKTPRLLS